MAQLHFLGASETVTGSKYLLQTEHSAVMIDCGLFQGIKKLRLLNWESPPIDIPSLQHIIITHGHLDHVGFLPRLYSKGFRGTIYASEPTIEITNIVLEDSARIQEEEADRANKHGYTKHNPAHPLYTTDDVQKLKKHFKPINLKTWTKISDDIKFQLHYAGHILGATFIELLAENKTFIFSGDVGRTQDDILFSPELPTHADYLLIETTYGNRKHPGREIAINNLINEIRETIKGGGTVIIPSFAVERTQDLMLELYNAIQKELLPNIPMYIDSPMGKNVMDVFRNHPDWHKLKTELCQRVCNAFTMVKDIKETYTVINNKAPKIIIAGSGMISGGRVLHYLTHYVSKPETKIILVGYQAAGTRGRRLLEGDNAIKIFGEYLEVKATTKYIEGFSAHADYTELIHFLSMLDKEPTKTFLVHGESDSMDAFRTKLRDFKQWKNIYIPTLYEVQKV